MLMVSALHTAVLHTLNTYGLLQSQMMRWCHTVEGHASASTQQTTIFQIRQHLSETTTSVPLEATNVCKGMHCTSTRSYGMAKAVGM